MDAGALVVVFSCPDGAFLSLSMSPIEWKHAPGTSELSDSRKPREVCLIKASWAQATWNTPTLGTSTGLEVLYEWAGAL